MECKNRIKHAVERVKESGGVNAEQSKALDELFSPFSSFTDVRRYILAKENLRRSNNSWRVFQALLFTAQIDAEIKEQYQKVIEEMIGALKDYLDGANSDYEYATVLKDLLSSLHNSQKFFANGQEVYLSRSEFDQLTEMLPKLEKKVKEDYGNSLCVTRCKKCGWQIGIPKKYGIHGMNDVDACPNCTPGLPVSTRCEQENGDNYLVGKFGVFYLDRKPYPYLHEVKKIVPIPKKVNFTPRDHQKGRMYSAEARCEIKQDGIQFQSLEEMQAYTDELVSSDEFRKQFGGVGHLSVISNENRSESYAMVDSGIIAIANSMKNEYVLLHEIAHHILWNQPTYIKNNQQQHGALYAYILLKLVRMKMGDRVADKLAKAFDEGKVKWREGKPLFDEMQQVIVY